MNMALMPTGGTTRPPAPFQAKGMAGTPRDVHIAVESHRTSPLFSPLLKKGEGKLVLSMLPMPLIPGTPSCLLPSEVGGGVFDSARRRIHYGVLLYGSLSPTARLIH